MAPGEQRQPQEVPREGETKSAMKKRLKMEAAEKKKKEKEAKKVSNGNQ